MKAKHLFRLVCTAAFAAVITCSSAFGLYAGKITGNDVNFRQTAGGAVMSKLNSGDKVAVIENSGEWYKIAVNGMTGYVSNQFVTGIEDSDFAIGTATVVCDTYVNVRQNPNTDSSVLTTVSNGGYVWVAGVKDGWYKVTVGDITGYMAESYVNINSRMPAASRGDSDSATELRNKVINFAANYLGTPYKYGGSSPSTGFDCSGFTSFVYANTVRSIPRTATTQLNSATRVSKDELKPADLVFFGSNGSITHVGIYVGNGQFIHSPQTGSVIRYDTLWSGNYSRRFVSGARIIFD